MSKLRSLGIRWRRLTGPAPLSTFADYDEYWAKRGGIAVTHRRWAIAAAQIDDNSTLLDVGCGGGEFLQYLKSVKPSVRASGMDVSGYAVKQAQDAGFEAGVLNIGEEDIDKQYDYVTCFEVLEHIPEAETAIQRLKRAFRRRLIVSVPNVGYFGCRIRLGIFGRFPTTNCIMHIKEHVRHWTVTDFREWADHHDLSVIKAEGQYGVTWSPWRRWPSLFASGLVYVMEHKPGGEQPLEPGQKRPSP